MSIKFLIIFSILLISFVPLVNANAIPIIIQPNVTSNTPVLQITESNSTPNCFPELIVCIDQAKQEAVGLGGVNTTPDKSFLAITELAGGDGEFLLSDSKNNPGNALNVFAGEPNNTIIPNIGVNIERFSSGSGLQIQGKNGQSESPLVSIGTDTKTGALLALNGQNNPGSNQFDISSSSSTSDNLINIFQGTSNFFGNGIMMNLGFGSSFTGNFVEFEKYNSPKFIINSNGKISNYMGYYTQGAGVDTIVGNNDVFGQTTGVSVLSENPSNDEHTYRANCYMSVNSISSGNILCRLSFTDHNSNNVQINMISSQNSIGHYSNSFVFKSKGNSIISINTLTNGTINYDSTGVIELLN